MKHSNDFPTDCWIGKGEVRRNIIEGDLGVNHDYKKKSKAERLILKLLKSKYGNVTR